MPKRTPVVSSKPLIPDPPPSAPALTPPDAPKSIREEWEANQNGPAGPVEASILMAAAKKIAGHRACAVCGTHHGDVCPTCGNRHGGES